MIEHESVSFVDFWGENVPARSTVSARSWPGAVSRPVLLKQSKQEGERRKDHREGVGGVILHSLLVPWKALALLLARWDTPEGCELRSDMMRLGFKRTTLAAVLRRTSGARIEVRRPVRRR